MSGLRFVGRDCAGRVCRVVIACLLLMCANGSLAQTPGGIRLEDGTGRTIDVSMERIASLPRHTETGRQKTSSGGESVEWSGPLLWDVLVAEKIIDPGSHNEHVRLTLLVKGRDGYTARLALAEISPDFANRPVLLADRMNGTALPDHSLKLFVPGEAKGGRSVRDPTSITLEHARGKP